MRRDLSFRAALLGLAAAAFGMLAAALLAASSAAAPAVVVAALIAAAAAAVAGYALFFVPSRALRQVSAAADRMATGELGQRVPISGGPVEALTASFNGMGDTIEQLLAAIAAEHGRLEAVFEAATDAMVSLTRDTTVAFLNPAAARTFGTSPAAALGRPLIESARDYELDALVRRSAQGATEPQTVVIQFGAGRIPLRAVAVPIRNGGAWAVLLVLTDLTEVARVDQVRRDFLSNVSHELRTPLASIRALVETIESGAVEPPESAEFLARIRLQVDRITSLVNELLDLSRIESGALELHPESIDLAALAREAADLLRTKAETCSVTIATPPEDGLRIEGDRLSLLRAVSNLLDNAIKYSPPGAAVHVTVAAAGELGELVVRDEGPGIPPHELPRVFERFYKGDVSRANAGSGLGLAIVKHVVRVHGGTVEASSAEGLGATFTVRLPRTFVGPKPAAPARPTRAPGRGA